jgi:hypothetical protein
MYVIQAFVPGRGLRILDPRLARREPFRPRVFAKVFDFFRRRRPPVRPERRPTAVACAAVWISPPGMKLPVPIDSPSWR